MTAPCFWRSILRLGLCSLFAPLAASATFCDPAPHALANSHITAEFGDRGLTALRDHEWNRPVAIASDAFSFSIDGHEIRSVELGSPTVSATPSSVRYSFTAPGYKIAIVYSLKSSWRFVSKRLIVSPWPGRRDFHVDQIQLWDVHFGEPNTSDYVARSRWYPQGTPNRNYGIFERFPDRRGLFALIQNPFLAVNHDPSTYSLSYAPDMIWKASDGPLRSDVACIGTYILSGQSVPVTAVDEWLWLTAPATSSQQEDESEIEAFTDCVHGFLLDPHTKSVKMDVGWTENDYQIDVATEAGQAEYKRIIDRTATLGAGYLVYGPSNSAISNPNDDADDWGWEHVLWLGLGQKIRKREWNVDSDPIPPTVQQFLDYAKSKDVKLVAYVYPDLPFAGNPKWLVKAHKGAVNLANRDFQDWLVRTLLAFYRRTGIGGYSFDYTWLDLPGASEYAQWFAWRRVLRALRAADPTMVIDGRQRYQAYGPWIWLAGSYPHPTSTDEQPESFTPFPDLHFDRVSADRERCTAYLYRIDDFCPPELMPGFIGHQSSRNDDSGERVNTDFRTRDWDYLGWRYSLISSIAVAGFNNVLNMIPARDLAEDRRFTQADVEFIRHWLDWTERNRPYLLNTRFILGQPQIGKVDGTSAFIGSKGYMFLFNPNGRRVDAKFYLDRSIGLDASGPLELRELWPLESQRLGKPGAGIWNPGDEVSIPLDGASALILEVSPAPKESAAPRLFNAPGTASLRGSNLNLSGLRGETGASREVEVLLSSGDSVSQVQVNGQPAKFSQSGRVVAIPLKFAGAKFSHMQQVGGFDPNFSGGVINAGFTIPQWVFDQLRERESAWPIPWTKDDLRTTWLAPQRLLFFIQIAEPNDKMSVHLELDGSEVALQKAYSSVRPDPGSFVGFYADFSNLKPDHEYAVKLSLPALEPGQFQGMFFDNVESRLTTRLAP